MKFSILKTQLFKALSHVQSVVEKRNTIPILSNLLLSVEKDTLSMTATDLDVEMIETADAIIQEHGAVTLPAHTLYEIVRKIPESVSIDFEFKADEGRVYVSAGKIMFTLPCLPKDDFPLMSSADEGVKFQISASDLKKILDKSKFAISNEETRYYLNGIFLHYEAPESSEEVGRLVGVATDGLRLSRVKVPAPDGSQNMPSVILPRKTVMELRKLLEEGGKEIQISLSDAKVQFTFDNVVLTSKLIDGVFPDYKSVIPADNPYEVFVTAKQFIDAADRVSTVSSDKVRLIRLSLSNGKIGFYVENADLGFAKEEIDCKYTGENTEIGFNARYLIDVAAQIDTPEIQIKLGASGAPAVFSNKDDQSALYILMPMRI